MLLFLMSTTGIIFIADQSSTYHREKFMNVYYMASSMNNKYIVIIKYNFFNTNTISTSGSEVS